MKKKKGVRTVRWFLRAITNETHHNLGQSLGTDGASDPTRLQEKMRTADGEYDLWDCQGMSSKDVKRLALDFLNSLQLVYIYRKVGDGLPRRWRDEDVRLAEEAIEAIAEKPARV
ncbi:MAG: hypothetical protein KGI79_01495 [Patescibacteria group bacterium]|nr:hypothetical protein [Patescibacteria group bacterium]MDE2116531.1 hypothetical protein [Patescibacteria group bacterium]